MTNTDLPDWLTEGATVAILDGSPSDAVAFRTVERITATRIVVAGGRKFSTRQRWDSYPEQAGGGGKLVAPDSENALNIYARNVLRSLVYHVEKYVRDSRATCYTANVADVRSAFDKISDLVNQARAELDRRAGQ